MDLDRRTILAFLLIGLVLIFMQTSVYKRWLYPGGMPQKPTESKAVVDTLQIGAGVTSGGRSEDTQTSVSFEGLRARSAVMRPVWEGPEFEERTIVVRTSLYEGTISTRGGVVRSWKMLRYQRPDSESVELVGLRDKSNLALRFVTDIDTVDTGEWPFSYAGPDTLELADGETDSVVLHTALTDGRRIEKRFVFAGGRYDVDLSVVLEGWDASVADRSYRLVWSGGMRSSEARVAEDAGYTKAYALLGKSLEKFDVGRSRAKQDTISGITHWVAQRTKYFTVSVIPLTRPGEAAEFRGWKEELPAGEWKYYEVAVRMPLVKPLEAHEFRVYLGPLDYYIVRTYGVGLERMMDFGWSVIRPISKGILLLFRWFHNFIPNYGIVLIIFSVLVKIAVYPLTRKSYVSMKQMQMLQPRLAELKEKYGKDPQRLNRETMKLYKEYGVNPMSGCLPMLLQFPLLYALFIVFRSTIELRGARFVWWIRDLSQPDTIAQLPFSIPLYGDSINVLPIVMAITMLVQQKMSVTDPKQKAMVYIMPLFFMLLFNNFPSGLNLYYTLFNVLTIIQQKLIPEAEVQIKPRKEERGGRRRGALRRA